MQNWNHWLESHWAAPAYGGLVLAGIAICFFGAATNTMAGWLYVISGIMGALLLLGAILPARSLKQLELRRTAIAPVSAGDRLTVELEIANPTAKPKTLLQVWDLLPSVLGEPAQTALELIPPRYKRRWVYYYPTQQRGVYRWGEVQLRTATPLGLFWCRRSHSVPAKAVVYPTVLPLTRCPLIDTIGQEESLQVASDRRYQAATEGITRTLRPYRYGDPTRLIHWRSSARLGEFQVRELEIVTSGQDLIIALDTASLWQGDRFEQAVIAAASLYFYASRSQVNVKLWTASTGLVQGNRVVLEALAATQMEEETPAQDIPPLPLIWIAQTPNRLDSLPAGSRCCLFPSGDFAPKSPFSGLAIAADRPLERELQKPLRPTG